MPSPDLVTEARYAPLAVYDIEHERMVRPLYLTEIPSSLVPSSRLFITVSP